MRIRGRQGRAAPAYSPRLQRSHRHGARQGRQRARRRPRRATRGYAVGWWGRSQHDPLFLEQIFEIVAHRARRLLREQRRRVPDLEMVPLAIEEGVFADLRLLLVEAVHDEAAAGVEGQVLPVGAPPLIIVVDLAVLVGM